MKGGTLQHESGWVTARKKVFRNRVPQWDSYSKGKKSVDAKVASIFIFYFPDRCKAKDLFDVFRCLGEIYEALIAPRRDMFGNRFSFARFTEVEDVTLLAVKLDNILFDGKRFTPMSPV